MCERFAPVRSPTIYESTMKPLFLIIVFFAFAGNQIVCAEDSRQVQYLEAEINSLKQATLDQSERIQSLEDRVSLRSLAFSKKKSSSSGADSNTDDGPLPDNSSRKKDGLYQKYID